jgi:hypothetical protein
MPDVFLCRNQALKAAIRFLVVAVHIHQNLRRAAIVSHMHRGHAHQPDARIGQLPFHQRFDLLTQSFAQPPAMIFDRALLHSSPRRKTHENIRKLDARVGPEVLLSRTKEGSR